MPLQIIVPGANFDTNLPVLNPIDDIVSAGSLFLFDAANPDQEITLPTFDVTNTEVVLPNLVKDNAAVLCSADADDCTLMQQTIANNANTIAAELTTAGGIHVATSRANQDSSGPNHYKWLAPNNSPISDYLKGVIDDHEIYISMWYRLTRENIAVSAAQAISYWAVNTSAYGWFGLASGIRGAYDGEGLTYLPRYPFNLQNASDVGRSTLLNAKIRGTMGAMDPNLVMNIFTAGNSDAWRGFNENASHSGILYRLYIEDLTVSGRTYEEVSALDEALYDQAFSAGGVYSSDGYSVPSGMVNDA